MMDEYVSKETVLELLCEKCPEQCIVLCCPTYLRIHQHPAADVKPVVKGKWIWKPDKRWWECDQCGETTTDACMGKPRANYCQWCGADMRGSNGEQE